LAAFATLLSISITLWLTVHQPWLGIQLQAIENGQGLEILSVHSEGPSANILQAGDTLISIGSIRGTQIKLDARDLIEDPDIFPTFSAYDHFLEKQQKLSDIITQPVMSLVLDGGRTVRIQPESLRPVSDLPPSFWALALFGSIAIMLGAGIWAVQKQSMAVRLLFASGVGFMIGACATSVYSARELAMAAESIKILSAINHAGNNMFAVCGLGLLWHYPKPVARFPATLILTMIVAVIMVNEQLRWFAFPGHVFYVTTAALFVLAVCYAILQWGNTADDLIDRAALKWFLIVIMLSMSATVLVFFIPAYLFGETLFPIADSYGVVLLMYVGLALGVYRYRLFDIDRWWFELWLWFFAGAAVIAIDIALSMYAQSVSEHTLLIVLIAVGWIYFPLRQKLWGRFVHRSGLSLDQYLPDLVTALINSGKVDINQQWQCLLNDIFSPLHIRSVNLSLDAPKLGQHGETMILPAIKGERSIKLLHANHGTRLFSSADTRLAEALLQIMRRTESQIEAQIRGASKERERIMRDLHDDVGGRLLTLAHANREENKPELARDALRSLREIIYSLDGRAEKRMDTAVAHWRNEIHERCTIAGVKFIWQWPDSNAHLQLSARQYLNLNSVLSEAVSNALKHANADWIEVSEEISSNATEKQINAAMLHITIRNNGIKLDQQHKPGKGLVNMANRMKELNGSFSFEQDDASGVCVVRITMPLS